MAKILQNRLFLQKTRVYFKKQLSKSPRKWWEVGRFGWGVHTQRRRIVWSSLFSPFLASEQLNSVVCVVLNGRGNHRVPGIEIRRIDGWPSCSCQGVGWEEEGSFPEKENAREGIPTPVCPQLRWILEYVHMHKADAKQLDQMEKADEIGALTLSSKNVQSNPAIAC